MCSFANRQGGSMLLGASDDGAVEGIPETSRSTSSGAYPTSRATRTCSTYRRWSSSKGCTIQRAGSSYGSGSPWGRPSTRSRVPCTTAWRTPMCA
nr:ATP-binding protein [Enorma massiliensis]